MQTERYIRNKLMDATGGTALVATVTSCDRGEDYALISSLSLQGCEGSPHLVALIHNRHLTDVPCCHFCVSLIRNEAHEMSGVMHSAILSPRSSVMCINKYYVTEPPEVFSRSLCMYV
jgi:hypothetical protein